MSLRPLLTLTALLLAACSAEDSDGNRRTSRDVVEEARAEADTAVSPDVPASNTDLSRDPAEPTPDIVGEDARRDSTAVPSEDTVEDAGIEDEGDPYAPAPSCRQRCGTAADCDLGIEPYSADNWACESGACLWTGCNDDTECEAVHGTSYACRDVGVFNGVCQETCELAADCANANETYDAENWSCNDGTCAWLGCLSHEECQADFGEDYLCADGGFGIRSCFLDCDTEADCDLGSSSNDSNNYECIAGACIWIGCQSTDECVADLGADYVCR